jgi:hypothetical protein
VSAEEFFNRHVREDPNLSNIETLHWVLPNHPDALRDIQRLCLLAVGQKSLPSAERKRLDRLARQLGVLARNRAKKVS